MQPRIGDAVHFQAICAGCQKFTNTHYIFTINEREVLASLPRFDKRTRLADTGFYVYWDHYFSNVTTWLMNLKGFFGRDKVYGFPDTYLIILTGQSVFIAGPDSNIIPMPIEQVSDSRVLSAVDSAGITHFNYVDLTSNFDWEVFVSDRA